MILPDTQIKLFNPVASRPLCVDGITDEQMLRETFGDRSFEDNLVVPLDADVFDATWHQQHVPADIAHATLFRGGVTFRYTSPSMT
jgi:hypothetical protein